MDNWTVSWESFTVKGNTHEAVALQAESSSNVSVYMLPLQTCTQLL